MPVVRFSRDKRGYEYVYLVHTPTRRGRTGRSRVLYWYRTPPGVLVGRKPFDIEIQRALEQQNPGVQFDWEVIVGTPMPPPDMTEFWRERRRAEKTARQERRAMEAEESATADSEAGPDAAVPGDAPEREVPLESAGTGAPEATLLLGAAPFESAAVAPAADGQSRKRSRRRGRRRPSEPTADGSTVLPRGRGASAEGSQGLDSDPSDGDDSASEGE